MVALRQIYQARERQCCWRDHRGGKRSANINERKRKSIMVANSSKKKKNERPSSVVASGDIGEGVRI